VQLDYLPLLNMVRLVRTARPRIEPLFNDEAFMAAELKPGALQGCGGLVKYRPEFADAVGLVGVAVTERSRWEAAPG